jgi:hypothetical protein
MLTALNKCMKLWLRNGMATLHWSGLWYRDFPNVPKKKFKFLRLIFLWSVDIWWYFLLESMISETILISKHFVFFTTVYCRWGLIASMGLCARYSSIHQVDFFQTSAYTICYLNVKFLNILGSIETKGFLKVRFTFSEMYWLCLLCVARIYSSLAYISSDKTQQVFSVHFRGSFHQTCIAVGKPCAFDGIIFVEARHCNLVWSAVRIFWAYA